MDELMSTYYLRAEAVNFEDFVLDTSDLSTIRGGGLLLLEAFEGILDRFPELVEIYKGGSIGFYYFKAPGAEAAETVRSRVEAELRAGNRKYATFVVDIEQGPDIADPSLDSNTNVDCTHRLLLSKNRLRQISSMNFNVPRATVEGSLAALSDIDDVRPAQEWPGFLMPGDGESANNECWILSEATQSRRIYGIEKKHTFYNSVKWDTSPYINQEFQFHNRGYTNDFDQISIHPDKGSISGKIALIYLDGNKFGEAFASMKTIGQMRQWSRVIHANQRSLLSWLLSLKCEGEESTPGNPVYTSWHWSGWQTDNNGIDHWKDRVFRIETLLWGADEMMFAVPAWCGWWFLGSVLNNYGKTLWKTGTRENGMTEDKDEWDVYSQGAGPSCTQEAGGTHYSLTHGASVIFCHATAPIRRMVRLARALADEPKSMGTFGRDSESYLNLCTYEVFESFDSLGDDPVATRLALMPPILRGLGTAPMVLRGEDVPKVAGAMDAFRQRFPRSKLHRVLEEYALASTRGEQSQVADAAGTELRRAEAEKEFLELAKLFTPGWSFAVSNADCGIRTLKEQAISFEAIAATWMHIFRLWDYTPIPDWTWPTVQSPPETATDPDIPRHGSI